MTQRPRAFLCHASEDDVLAAQIARDLQQAGIDTFFDKWSIRPGDSIRKRIDQGLRDCTHFLVLLTPVSIEKPWVNAEMDAAFVRKVEGLSEFLPVRYELPAERLPPLIASLHAPQLRTETYDEDLRGLIGSIYNISQKPPLGDTPTFARRATSRRVGLSIGAQRVAKVLIEQSSRGRRGDPKIEVDDLLKATFLTIDELESAVDELETGRLVKPLRVLGCPPLGYFAVEPTESLFIRLDPLFMPWNPKDDAVRLAAELLNSGAHWLASAETAERLEWEPRRMNPALAYLIRRGAVLPSKSIDPSFVARAVAKNNRTQRFVRDRQ